MYSEKTDNFNEINSRKVSFILGLGILFFPIIFSWFTLRKGYSKLAKIVSFSWLIITLIFTMYPIYFNKNNTPNNIVSDTQTEITEAHTSENAESNIFNSNYDLIAIDSSIPNLNKFYDLNSRDIEHSLVYWSLANTDNGDNYTGEDLLSIFIPEVFSTQSPFEREKITSKFSEDYPKIQEYIKTYKGIKYVSIPISFKSPKENWIVYARNDKEKNIYYDEEKKGFYNFCPIVFISKGPAYGNVRGAVSRDVSTHAFTNTSMELVYKKNENDDSLCFLPMSDRIQAENIYNANQRYSLITKGKIYLKLSSITNPENKSMRFYFYDDKGGTTYDSRNQVVAEILAIDLELYDDYEDQKNPKLIYKGIIKSLSFYK